ncbi:hypothetical protein NDU88_000600 [Pleurodeles waltl]|uniref:Uncharacterized protein n=1 Tax=Pleurodeles waltl TaxID=8319 RepID=A0AAV7MMI8_PLEWA|nr:hypothetical protein NDU88_000600 [Pleurodeles waltl]
MVPGARVRREAHRRTGGGARAEGAGGRVHGRTGSARTIPLLVLALPLSTQKSSTFTPIRTRQEGHGGKTEA